MNQPSISPTASSTTEQGQESGALDEEKDEKRDKAKRGDKVDGAKVEVVAAMQEEGEIKYRTMSWKKCAAILFGEYVCLAILSFPWAFKTLGECAGRSLPPPPLTTACTLAQAWPVESSPRLVSASLRCTRP